MAVNGSIDLVLGQVYTNLSTIAGGTAEDSVNPLALKFTNEMVGKSIICQIECDSAIYIQIDEKNFLLSQPFVVPSANVFYILDSEFNFINDGSISSIAFYEYTIVRDPYTKGVRIKQADGTFGDKTHYGTDAKYVDVTDADGNVTTLEQNLQDLKAYIDVTLNDIIEGSY